MWLEWLHGICRRRFGTCQTAGLDAVKRELCCLSGSMRGAAEGLASLEAVKRELCGLSGSMRVAGKRLEGFEACGFEACQTAGLDAVKRELSA